MSAMTTATLVPQFSTQRIRNQKTQEGFELETKIPSSSSSEEYITPTPCRLHSKKKILNEDSDSSSGVSNLTQKIEQQVSGMSFVRDRAGFNRFEDISTGEEMEERDKINSKRDKIYNVLAEPSSGIVALLYMILNFCAIILSTASFVLGTLPDYHDPSDPNLDLVEDVSIFIFSFDYFARLILTRNHRIKFTLDFMNLVDLLAIIPFYFELLADFGGIHVLLLLRILRLFRIFRILKLLKYSQDVPVIVNAFSASASGLVLGAFVLALCSVIWASAVYYGEQTSCYFDPYDELWKYSDTDDVSPFQSVPETLWFVFVTMTTVGYGDEFPLTPLGKLSAALAMICGVFVISIPLSILATNFALEFRKQAIHKGLQENYLRNKKKKVKPLKLPLDRVLAMSKILKEFKESVKVAKNRVDDFGHKFSKLESKLRGLKRHYRRQDAFNMQTNNILNADG